MMKAYILRLALVVGLVGLLLGATGSDVELKNGHPQKYYVKEGDTLWGIAALYLESPWQWPEIWYRNDQIENPHLIYPGDVLEVIYVEGRPRIVMTERAGQAVALPAETTAQASAGTAAPTSASSAAVAQTTTGKTGDRTVKLQPQARVKPLGTAIPAVPLESIQAYLNDTRVVDRKVLRNAPHVVAGEDGRILAGNGDVVYARDKHTKWEPLYAHYGLYRGGEEYFDPDTGESLGLEAYALGNAKVLSTKSDIATMRVVDAGEDIRIDDRLLPKEERRVDAIFYPRGPGADIEGKIIRVYDSISHVGQYDVVVINKGLHDGIEEGHVLSVMRAGEKVKDRINDEMLEMPRVNAGLVIVFRTFERVSYALVMKARRPMQKGDSVTNPQYGY